MFDRRICVPNTFLLAGFEEQLKKRDVYVILEIKFINFLTGQYIQAFSVFCLYLYISKL